MAHLISLCFALCTLAALSSTDAYICCKNVLVRNERDRVEYKCVKMYSPFPCPTEGPDAAATTTTKKPNRVLEPKFMIDPPINEPECPPGQLRDHDRICRDEFMFRRRRAVASLGL